MYNHVVIGGTFDHLHAGHKAFVGHACKIGTRVTIAVTTDSFIAHKKLASQIQPRQTRVAELERYLAEQGWREKVEIVELSDVYGSSIFDTKFDAIVVTPDTYPNAMLINDARVARALPPLDIISIDLVTGTDRNVISSERIRLGHTSRDGVAYSVLFQNTDNLMLPSSLRKELLAPIGDVYEDGGEEGIIAAVLERIKTEKPPMVISVGDIVTHSMIQAGFRPDIAIVDGHSKRRAVDLEPDMVSTMRYPNTAGTVSQQASDAVRQAISSGLTAQQSVVISIDGEEDLLALPAIVYAPLGSVVLYGLADRGVVYVEVTEGHKEKSYHFLQQFTA